MSIVLGQLTIGEVLPAVSVHLDRAALVRYAGASGDFNPIHWNARVATAVGLPDVIAHGMLTMAQAVTVVTRWTGDPADVLEYGVRFTRPVVVADPDGAELEISAMVGALDADARTARIDITATFDGKTVLGKARAVVRCR
ncbi:MaoC/PaaZ C-terminal domain-containing protein [Nakamurella sp. A5-74]|uniref:MaoC/PaaZ C-terminal domain-containing protein n=1 Tax=Nakamurella sp. A5-74 TaxID=3158264 RepID=A0AAU8DRM8_9ACTN